MTGGNIFAAVAYLIGISIFVMNRNSISPSSDFLLPASIGLMLSAPFFWFS